MGSENYFRWDIELKDKIPFETEQKHVNLLIEYAEELIKLLDENGEFDRLLNLL